MELDPDLLYATTCIGGLGWIDASQDVDVDERRVLDYETYGVWLASYRALAPEHTRECLN